jgi:exodeoxyribonuclease-3
MKKSSLLVLIVLVFVDFAPAQIPETSNLRIMTYNIWNGFDWGKDSIRKESTIEWIKSQKPDVLALQELCNYTEEKLKEEFKHFVYHTRRLQFSFPSRCLLD